ncbi:MAG: diaminopimelate epimerase [SAR324 cluster bacterium]|nr:diaminopimelate epimerase [SAR324 cluster bacterium]
MGDYWKYHGLGNDYLVMEPERFTAPPGSEAIRRICDRQRGVGADGILLGPLSALPGKKPCPGLPALRIFNPDGSEGEKSGTGLRIFARYLWERGHVRQKGFSISTLGGEVGAEVLDATGGLVAIAMGRVSFASGDIPMAGPPREVLQETLEVDGREVLISGAGLGNPHCVVQVDDPTPELARELGPGLENHPQFPNRTNVQFMTVLDEHRIRIEIWERGAGYTLSSGSSSCAAAAVACRLSLCRSPLTVSTRGGDLKVELDENFHARLEGPVKLVGHGRFSDEFLAELGLVRSHPGRNEESRGG